MISTVNKYINKKFGKLTILKYSRKSNSNSCQYFFCKCDCGKIKEIRLDHLKTGRTISCGCFSKNLHTKHGHSSRKNKSSSYTTYHGMLQRCYNKNAYGYEYYGGRGIIVCDFWLKSFENFLADVGEKPKGMTLDRIDINGNYCKENCRWATLEQQARNTRKRKNGKCKYKGIHYNKDKKKYCAQICTKGKRLFLGYYKTQEEAAIVYNNKVLELWGKDGHLNIIGDFL